MGVLIKQSPPNFPKNEHFFPLIHTRLRFAFFILLLTPVLQIKILIISTLQDAKMILEFSHFVLQ